MSRITTQSLFATSVHKSSWRGYAVSITVHGGLAALVFAVVVPVAVEVHKSIKHVRLIAPVVPVIPKHQFRQLRAPNVTAHAIITLPNRTFVPPPVVVPPVKSQQIPEAPEIKPVPVQPQLALKVPLPEAPRAPIQPGSFERATELAKTTPAPPQKLETGGFGDPHGARPSDSARDKPAMPAKVGSFDLAVGASRGGSSANGENGGAIRQTGFGTMATRPRAVENSEVIRPTSFGETMKAPPANRNGPAVDGTLTPIEILFKPKPQYTAEARDLRLEGEVSLEVVFQANGTVRILRIVRGLGHGLDEAAEQAALRVRFKPAMRGGVPLDTNATIKISFELT